MEVLEYTGDVYILDEDGYVLSVHAIGCKSCKALAIAGVRMDRVVEDILVQDTCPWCRGPLHILTFELLHE